MPSPPAPTLAESWLELPDDRLFWEAGRCAIGRQSDFRDAAVVANLIPGNHTRQVSGVAGAIAAVIVEIYEFP